MTAHPAGAIRFVLALLATVVSASLVPVMAQNNASDTAKLIEVLQVKPGSIVAEIGAGSGDLTIALAKHVGPDGRVYTSELGTERLASLRKAVTKSEAGNIEVIEGQAAHANLPEGCCDAVFMRNVYHHFDDPSTMNASFLRALKPGGRIAVIDFAPRNKATVGPPGQRGTDKAHGVSVDIVSNELKAAGFTIAATEDRGDRWFLLVGVKARE
jgi:ubiquinone/menaquinone biosynthesis C-methylase UbiE